MEKTHYTSARLQEPRASRNENDSWSGGAALWAMTFALPSRVLAEAEYFILLTSVDGLMNHAANGFRTSLMSQTQLVSFAKEKQIP